MTAGPFYFAWVDENETVFRPEHVRVDENIFSFTIEHSEGSFPTLEIEIRNPKVGLLASHRKVWAWFAYDKQNDLNSELASDSEPSERGIVPLFFGRLVGIPTNINQEVVTLQFIARPKDYTARQAFVAEQLKVPPFWDAIWFDPEKVNIDPDLVLESRPELWHIDRVSHEVSTSNIIQGEDGTLTFDDTNVFQDSIAIEFGEPPVRRVELTAAVSWDQKAVDETGISLREPIFRAFQAIGSGYAGGPGIATYTGKGLQDDWPKPGASLGSGWIVRTSGLSTGAPYPPAEFYDREPLGIGARSGGFPDASNNYPPNIQQLPKVPGSEGPLVWGYNSPFAMFVVNIFGGRNSELPRSALRTPKIWFPLWLSVPTLNVGYDVSRQRREVVSITLEADMQSIVTDPGESDVIHLSMESAEVVTPLDADDSGEPLMPIRDVRARTYFATPRGTQSIEYLIAVCRAQLLARARAVFITFEIDCALAVESDLSCRKNVTLNADCLPGGTATGKIVEYKISGNGDQGLLACSIKIGCAIGRGGSVTAELGTPTYVEEGYFEPGEVQLYSGRTVAPFTGEITYGAIEGQLPDDDGIDFFQLARRDAWRDVVISCSAQNGRLEQESKMYDGGGLGDQAACFARLNEAPTRISLSLKPLNGSFRADWFINTSNLIVPRMIDLEAS